MEELAIKLQIAEAEARTAEARKAEAEAEARKAEAAAKARIAEAEAKARIAEAEARKAEANFARTGDFSGMVDPLGQKESEYWDTGPGLARVRGEIRTSWIVDPPNGKLPYNPETIKRFHYDDPKWHTPLDNPEDQTVTTRCVASEGGAPPNINSPDGNYLQIVQTDGYVLLLSEKYNDLRIVRLRETAHQPAAIQSWLGDAVGRWEGETLVVDSTNLCPSTVKRTDGMKISPIGFATVEPRKRPLSSARSLLARTTPTPPHSSKSTPATAPLPRRSSPCAAHSPRPDPSRSAPPRSSGSPGARSTNLRPPRSGTWRSSR